MIRFGKKRVACKPSKLSCRWLGGIGEVVKFLEICSDFLFVASPRRQTYSILFIPQKSGKR